MSIMAAALVWAWLALAWLKTGIWPSYTVIDAACLMVTCGPDSWAMWPTSWLGVHKALMWLSPQAGLLIVGLALISIAIATDP